MIFPIPDSKWVIPTQVVPKKSGVIVVKNKHGDLVPTRVQNGWRVCIDYHRLNATMTIKDHFPYPLLTKCLRDLQGGISIVSLMATQATFRYLLL